MLAVGDIVPDTDIATDTGRYSIAQHHGKKMVIFFFHAPIPPAVQKNQFSFPILLRILPCWRRSDRCLEGHTTETSQIS